MSHDKEISDCYPWITNKFFEDILKKKENFAQITVKSFSLKKPLAKGENYGSDILKADIKYLTGSHNQRSETFIIKAGLGNADMQDLLEDFDIFKREIAVYELIMPEIDYLKMSVKDVTKLVPEAFAISSKPKYFVFEDLNLLGYKNTDRKVGLDIEHLKLTMVKLAKFHAASVVLYDKSPALFTNHHFQNISHAETSFYPLFYNTLNALTEQCISWKNSKQFVDKLTKFRGTLIDKAVKVYCKNANGFNVLTHGDLWSNNLMFKYNDKNVPTDVLMLDFSAGFFGSPGIDLAYLLCTSSTPDIQEKEIDFLLHFYHQNLEQSLKKYQYSGAIPSYLDIQIEFLRKLVVGFIFTMILIPLRLVEDPASADLTGLLADTDEAKEFRRTIASHPGYESRMEFLLDYFDRKGVLD